MQYADLKKMDMHMLVMYYRRLVEDIKKENKDNKDGNDNNMVSNPMSMMNNFRFPSMPSFKMPSINGFKV